MTEETRPLTEADLAAIERKGRAVAKIAQMLGDGGGWLAALQLVAEVRRLRAVLEWYADPYHFAWRHDTFGLTQWSAVTEDKGARARRALAGEAREGEEAGG